MVGAGGGHSKSSFSTITTPGAWGDTNYSKSGDIGDMILGLTGNGGTSSPLYTKLMDSINNPQYLPQTATGNNLINDIMTQTGSKSAVNGLGAPTQAGLAASIAPTMAGLQKDYTSNLQTQQQTGLASLMQLLGYAMPQVVAGNNSSGFNFNAGIGGK
jgi:hypothetical protein